MHKSKAVFMIGLFLIFGAVAVIADSIFISEDGIISKYLSSSGNAGVTQNVSYDNGTKVLVIEDGIIVYVDLNASDNETNETSEPTISTHATLSNNLVSYYDLDETNGAITNDLAGSNDGTIAGATVNVSGQINTAYNFDGTNDEINIPDNTSLDFGTGNFSINQWLKIESGKSSFISKQVGSSPYTGFSYEAHPTGVFVRVNSGTGVGGGGSIDDETWHMLTIVRENGVIKSYLDGDFNYNHGLLNGNIDTNLDFNFGKLPWGSVWYQFQLDEVGIWNRTINSTEILELYNSGDGMVYN